MTKGQNSSNKQKRENSRRKQIEAQKAKIQEEMELSRLQEQYDQEIIDRKQRTLKKRCIALLQKIGWGSFVAILIVSIVCLGSLIVLYLKSDINNCPFLDKYEELRNCPVLNNRTYLTKVFNIIQLLTGIISVIVGVWALILTYKSRQKSYVNELYIRKMVADTNPLDVDASIGYKENDLNPESLG